VRRVLVIGATGILGREVVSALAGATVVAAARTPPPGGVAFDAERELPDVAGFDLVVNCAAVLASEADREPERAVAVNERFPQALAATGARLVHISTDAVFAAGAGRCHEDDTSFATDVYGATKRRGEPDAATALTLRCSFVGRDPRRRRGLLEWLLAQPAGARVEGFADQAWNGLAATQIARAVGALADEDVFARARAEGPVHHLYEDPPLTKHELLELCARTFAHDVTVVPVESGQPSTRVLGSRYAVLRQCLESGPGRAAALAAIARRDDA
jgi:dTDP-4-dehydrorhamnose reductase